MPRLVRIGKYWHAEYYDSAKGFTTRRTTGTDDRREALKVLGECIAKESAPRTLAALKRTAVSDILATYYADNKNLPSKYAIKAALGYVVDEIPTQSVEWFGEQNQQAFITALKIRGLKDGTIQRSMGIIGRAIRLAYRKANANETPFIVTVKSSGHRNRILTDDEARALVKAAETENEKRLVLLLLTTGSRPQALMDLHRGQIDRDNRLLFLNSPDRAQNEKKHRPTIPMTQVLHEASASWQDGPVFRLDHKDGSVSQIKNVKYVWNKLRVRSGVSEEVTPYTCRHTVATELRKQGVPEWDVSGYLGHKAPGSSVTALYAHWRPDFQKSAAEAMDRYWRRINDRADAVDAGRVEAGDHPPGESAGVLGAGGEGPIWGIDDAP